MPALSPPLIRLALLIALSASGSAGAAQGSEPPLKLLDHGVICDVTFQGRREAPLTESGQINLIDQSREMDVTTPRVPARIGLSFGIRVVAHPGAGVPDARIVVTHPPLGPARVTVQSWGSPISPGGTGIGLFTFEHDYELVKGPWRFQILSGDTILVDQPFEVVEGYAVPEVQGECFAAEITS